MDPLERFDHPAWFTAAGTAVSYALILAFMFLLLFVVPYLAVSQLF